MFMSDISTPLNRTRTLAPVMAGFSAGAALGPAAGGVLIDTIGKKHFFLLIFCISYKWSLCFSKRFYFFVSFHFLQRKNVD